jgi:hypothetical protein
LSDDRARPNLAADFSKTCFLRRKVAKLVGFNHDLLALRQSILKAAFEGRLVPQDPTDEPASELLARLRSNYAGNGARQRRARAAVDFSHPSLSGLTWQSVDPRVEPADDD